VKELITKVVDEGDFFVTRVWGDHPEQMVYFSSTALNVLNESVVPKNEGPGNAFFRVIAERCVVDVGKFIWVCTGFQLTGIDETNELHVFLTVICITCLNGNFQ
jgi:hypothetical protein